MLRVALLLLCIFAACAVQTAAEASASATTNAIPPTYLYRRRSPFSDHQSGLTRLGFLGFKIYTGDIMFTRLGDISSCPVMPWTDAQTAARVRNVTVSFDKTFKKTPGVTYSLARLDSDERFNLRYDISIVEVTPKDFTITFNTWCNTYIYSAKVTYWVFGVSSTNDVCGMMVHCRVKHAKRRRRLQLMMMMMELSILRDKFVQLRYIAPHLEVFFPPVFWLSISSNIATTLKLPTNVNLVSFLRIKLSFDRLNVIHRCTYWHDSYIMNTKQSDC